MTTETEKNAESKNLQERTQALIDNVPTTGLATIPGATDLAIIGEQVGTIARPSELTPGDISGTEDINANEVKLPRLAIAQGLSHQMIPGDGQHIDGLTLFDLFNDLSEEIYGKGPLSFVPVKRSIKHMVMPPRKDGDPDFDPDVRPGDPRLDWTASIPGGRKDTPPVATTFIEFVVLLLRPSKAPEPIVLSISQNNKWNRRASDNLTTFIKLRNAPIYAGLYTVDTKVPARNDQGTFGVPTVKNAGFINQSTPGGAMLYAYAKSFYESLTDKIININREVPIDDSMAANPEDAGPQM